MKVRVEWSSCWSAIFFCHFENIGPTTDSLVQQKRKSFEEEDDPDSREWLR